MQLFDQLHPEWQEVLYDKQKQIHSLGKYLEKIETAPPFNQIFRSLSEPIGHTRVVIFGQDPYPIKGHAHGLAFSVDEKVFPLPASLRNIFQELSSDVGIDIKRHGDLNNWSDQGVMLINRILTTEVGSSMSHKDIGWQEITYEIAQHLGKRDVVAILWGNFAGELSTCFRESWVVKAPHPSPLSSYRGFFGSKPFSKTNAILEEHNIPTISW